METGSHIRGRARAGTAVLASLTTGAGLLAVALTAPAAAGEDPGTIPGNPSCADLGFPNELKIQAAGETPAAGTYTDGDAGTESVGDTAGFTVQIAYTDDDPVTFDFDATTPVATVLVKAGPEARPHGYDPAVGSASGLRSPKDDSISHISFCWPGGGDGGTTVPDRTTTTTVPDGTTTVPDGTTTTVPDEDDVVTPPATPVPGQPDFTG